MNKEQSNQVCEKRQKGKIKTPKYIVALCSVGACSLLLSAGLIAGMALQSTKADEILNENGYPEFNNAYRVEQVNDIATQFENGDLSANEADTALRLVNDYNPIEYLSEKNPDVSEKYEKLEIGKAICGTGYVATTMIGATTLGLGIGDKLAFYTPKKQKKLKEDKEEIMSK